MAIELADLLLHRVVNEIEVSHQLPVAGLVDHTLQETTHEAGVLGHGVGLLRAFTQLGSQSD